VARSAAMKSATMKSAAMKMVTAKGVSIEVVPAVVVVVMVTAKDEVTATVGTPTTVIGPGIRATQIRPRDIGTGERGTFASAEE
jgi:hypothetical protein